MNPIVHAGISWLSAQPLRSRRSRILVTIAGVAPDLDGLSLLGGVAAYGKYHHVLCHGVFAAALTAGICALVAKEQRAATAGLAFVAFHLHLLCDLAGSGPGWPLSYFWPVSSSEFSWSGQWNLASWQNSVIGMVTTVACLATALVVRRTFVEVFSTRVDAKVVAALRQRFLREPAPATTRE